MKHLFTIFGAAVICFSLSGQELPSGYRVTAVNKKVNEFPDQFDLSTPLNSFVTFQFLLAKGKESQYAEASSVTIRDFMPDSTAADVVPGDEEKKFLLNYTICEYIVYKDSIAGIICLTADSLYSIRTLSLENGKWVNCGEGNDRNIRSARKHFIQFWEKEIKRIPQKKEISKKPASLHFFTEYLKQKGNDPKNFVLEELKNYKTVIYGEIHRREASWNLCYDIVSDPRFIATTGVIFIEFESNHQNEIDQFFAKQTIDSSILLNIFRDYMLIGWNDRPRFDFLISLWHINQSLADNEKIKVVFVDTPRFYTTEGTNNIVTDRDEYMADRIISYLNSTEDPRNAFFIVGSGHVYNTDKTAGAIIKKNLPGAVYTFFTHCPRTDNFKTIRERIRNGVFDSAFAINGNKPVAFELINSPFGNEPFDGLYLDGYGKYHDNYDGYIFLGPLEEEPGFKPLTEMYDEPFIRELDRRFKLSGGNLVEEWGLKELSVGEVLGLVRKNCPGLMWEEALGLTVAGETK